MAEFIFPNVVYRATVYRTGAYAEPTNFESNFAKKMDGLLNEALNVLCMSFKVVEFSALISSEHFH